MSEDLATKRRQIMRDDNVFEVGLTTGKVFRVRRGSYVEHEDRDIVGTGGVVTFMNRDSQELVLTHVHYIQYVTYFVPSGYEEKY